MVEGAGFLVFADAEKSTLVDRPFDFELRFLGDFMTMRGL
jgi:hypothetical protein